MYPPLMWTRSLEGTFLLLIVGAFLTALMMRKSPRLVLAEILWALVALFFLATHLAWAYGDPFPVRYWGAFLTTYGMITLGFFVVSLPVAWLLRIACEKIFFRDRRANAPATAPMLAPAENSKREVTRRQVLAAVTAVAPVVAISGSFRGISNGSRMADVPRIVIRSKQLPREFDGMSILQLSDLHLGISRQVADLDRFIESLGERDIRPDLVLFTGDLADDLSQIVPAFQAAERLKPRLGIHSSLGNHEYLHGIGQSRREYERAHSNLLVERGLPIRSGNSTLYLAGTDDPLSVTNDITHFMQRTVERSMRDKPSDAFSILLSHRPEGFTHAARAGIDVTLSGHTHGGQIGFNGKSAFEPLFPDGYLWGMYTQNESTLYTTSGWGHWFPFRLGCPAEAPLIVLERVEA